MVSTSWTWGSRLPGILCRWRWAINDEDVGAEPDPCRVFETPLAEFDDPILTGDRSCLSKSLNSLASCLKTKRMPRWKIFSLFVLERKYYGNYRLDLHDFHKAFSLLWFFFLFPTQLIRIETIFIRPILFSGNSVNHKGSLNGTGTFSKKILMESIVYLRIDYH